MKLFAEWTSPNSPVFSSRRCCCSSIKCFYLEVYHFQVRENYYFRFACIIQVRQKIEVQTSSQQPLSLLQITSKYQRYVLSSFLGLWHQWMETHRNRVPVMEQFFKVHMLLFYNFLVLGRHKLLLPCMNFLIFIANYLQWNVGYEIWEYRKSEAKLNCMPLHISAFLLHFSCFMFTIWFSGY